MTDDVPQATKRSLNVGIVGAGLGGLAAAIAIARAGCDVTILEAAAELGEVGNDSDSQFGKSSRKALRFVLDLNEEGSVELSNAYLRRPCATHLSRLFEPGLTNASFRSEPASK